MRHADSMTERIEGVGYNTRIDAIAGSENARSRDRSTFDAP